MPPMPHPTPERTLTQRIQGGLARRAHALWKRWTSRGPDFPTEAALDWLIAALADSPDDLRAACLETLLDYGCTGAVSEWPRAAGKPDADPTPAIPHEDLASASSLELARSALVWYRQLEMQLADAAFFILEGRQTKDGDFPSPSRLFPNESVRDRILAVKYYLDAAQRRIAASFEAHGQELPTTIDPTDGRMVAATEWMRSLPAKAAVVDVGCGSGRFLLHLIEQFPDAEWTGVDPCPALLNRLPRSVRSHEGTLLRTNLPDAIFDGAFAVESLEHSLVPKARHSRVVPHHSPRRTSVDHRQTPIEAGAL